MTLLVSLIGEQPIPNLLPVRFLKPDENILVYSDRTKPQAERLRKLLSGSPDLHADLKTNAFAFDAILACLQERLTGAQDVTLNLTGGTKMMALAAFALAPRLAYPFVYLQTDGRVSWLYRYGWENGLPRLTVRETLPALVTAEDYLNAHLPGFTQGDFNREERGALSEGGMFEKAIHAALLPHFDQILHSVAPREVDDQIEIDLVLRCSNQVGIAEVKLGGGESPKRGLDQLKMAGEARYLGTYTQQFLIVAAPVLPRRIENLARKREITIVHVPEYRQGLPIPSGAAKRAAQEIRARLCG